MGDPLTHSVSAPPLALCSNSFFDPGSHVALRATAPHLVSSCQVLGVLRTEPRAGLQPLSPLQLLSSPAFLCVQEPPYILLIDLFRLTCTLYWFH